MTQHMVRVPLAHKLPKAEAVRLGATEARDYDPGENVSVPRGSAEMLASAAMLQVHPSDREGIERMLSEGAEPGTVGDATKPATVPAKPTAKPNVATPGNVAAQGE